MKFKDIFKTKWFKKKQKPVNPEFIVTPKQKPVWGKLNIGTIIRALFFFLLVTVPLGIFAYIIYHSTGLQIYEDSQVWNHMSVPNAHYIFILFWVGMGCLIATVAMIGSFWAITKYVSNKKIQTAYVFGIIILAVIGVLLAALSQYFYAKFYDFYLYEATTTNTDIVNDWAKDLTIKLSADHAKGNMDGIFDWMQSSVVWWVMFVQFMFLFGVGVTLQNALYSKSDLNDYEKYIADTKQEDAGIDFSKINKFFRNTFSNNDKSIAKFLIIAAVVVVIPNFVYSIIGTVESTHMQAVVAWGFKVPGLLKDIQPDKMTDVQGIMSSLNSSRYGSVFIVSSLPIIFEGLTIATLFFFIAMLLRGKNVSNRIFLVEAGVLLAEVIALVAVAFASKIYVHRLTDFWQASDGKGGTNLSQFTDELHKILGNHDYFALAGGTYKDEVGKWITEAAMYPLNNIQKDMNGIHIEWLSMSATIAEVVIAYAWVFGTFTLIGNGLYKLGYFKKANAVTYANGLFN